MKPAYSTLIHRISLNPRQDLRLELHQDGFRIRLDLRIWKFDPRTSRYCPSSKGLNLAWEHLEDLIAGLRLWGVRAEAWSQGIGETTVRRSVMVPEAPPGAIPDRD